MYVPSILLGTIATAVNAALRLDPDSLDRVAALAGKRIAIELRGLNLQIHIKPTLNGIVLETADGLPPDVTVSGTPVNLLRMLSAPTDSSLFASGEVQLRGDIELGQHLKKILQYLDLDWEELLSRYVGDLLAHPLGNGIRGFRAWGQQATNSLGQNLAEYLREEVQLLPDRNEVTSFFDSVDQLRADLGRLEARIQRLYRHP